MGIRVRAPGGSLTEASELSKGHAVSKKLIIGAVAAAGIATSFLVVRPMAYESCKGGMTELVVSAATDGRLTDEGWRPQASDLPFACQLTTSSQRSRMGAEVISENMGLIMVAGLSAAFDDTDTDDDLELDVDNP